VEMTWISEAGYRILLRRTGSASPQFIGEGMNPSLSCDGTRVAAIRLTPAPHIVILPVGQGEARTLQGTGLEQISSLAWSRDGNLLISGGEPKRGNRIFLYDFATNQTRPVSPEGCDFLGEDLSAFIRPQSPDGRTLLLRFEDKLHLLDLGGSAVTPRPLKGLQPGEKFAGWCADSRRIFLFGASGPVPGFWRLDPVTGTREPLHAEPPQGASHSRIARICFTPDGKSSATQLQQAESFLYLAEGLK